ncbi:MAG: acyl carrier protein [Luteibaculaceae bacterium]|jgi:acyl carrier protein
MTILENYNTAFVEAFAVQEKDLKELKYQSVTEWDSVGHMSLVATLEDVFEIEMDIDDIIDFSSYEKGKELMRKYGVLI